MTGAALKRKGVTVLLAALGALFVLAGASGQLTGTTPAIAQVGEPSQAACYVAYEGVISGAGYRLTSLVWQVSGVVTGGDYRLSRASVPNLRGSGCCCTYLPILLRNAP
jgi:hypothetical protein